MQLMNFSSHLFRYVFIVDAEMCVVTILHVPSVPHKDNTFHLLKCNLLPCVYVQ